MAGKGSVRRSGAKDKGEDPAMEPPKAFMENLVETSNAIIIGIDSAGTIRLFNNGARRSLGYTLEEVLGTSWFDYLPDVDAEKGRLEVLKFDIGSGTRTQYESRVRSRSGLTVTILLENTVIFGPEGDISMVLMVGQDISRTKELERTLKLQNERLEAALEELAIHTDILLHDMKNANASIMACLDLLELEGQGAKGSDLIAKAASEVVRSTSIINDVKVLTMTRPTWEPAPVDIDEALSKSIERLKAAFPGGGFKLDVERSGLHVLADDLLEEALVRVFKECLNECSVGGRLKVEVGRDIARSEVLPQPVRLTITGTDIRTDAGPDQDAIDERPMTEDGRSGLGMFVVRRIIARYNGLLFMEMTDEGRTVELLLSEAV